MTDCRPVQIDIGYWDDQLTHVGNLELAFSRCLGTGQGFHLEIRVKP